MKRKIISILISVFVLPGMGHVYLGKKPLGYGIAGLTLALVVGMIASVESSMIGQIQQIGGMTDPASLGLAMNQTISSSKGWYGSGSFAVGALWIGAILDLIRRPNL